MENLPVLKSLESEGFTADPLGRTDTDAPESMPQTGKEGLPLCWLG